MYSSTVCSQLLRAKLEARMKQREGLIVARQESEMKTLIEGNKFGAKVRRAMLVHKHMVEMEKFRSVFACQSGSGICLFV